MFSNMAVTQGKPKKPSRLSPLHGEPESVDGDGTSRWLSGEGWEVSENPELPKNSPELGQQVFTQQTQH